VTAARHFTHHVLCGVALHEAGRALTKKRRAVWLAVAAYTVARLHVEHHRN
jgi:hypothetical protein